MLSDSEEDCQSDTSSEHFLKKMFRKRKPKGGKNKKRKFSDNQAILKCNSADVSSDSPFQDVIKEKFNAFKKFTEDMFKSKKNNNQPNFLDNLRVSASDDEHLNDNMKLKRAISRELAKKSREYESSKKPPRQTFVQVQQK